MMKLSDKSWIDVRHMGSVPFEEVAELKAMCPTTREEINVRGNKVPIPRYQRLYGKHNYRYSGITLKAEPNIPRLVQRCLDWTKQNYGEGWEGALVNWYMDGTQYIGKHSDDEKDLVDGKPIISFSFGQARTFRIRPKRNPANYKDIVTGHGMVLVMGGDMQKEFTHEVPKSAKPMGTRLNITVRSFKPHARVKDEETHASDESSPGSKRIKQSDDSD